MRETERGTKDKTQKYWHRQLCGWDIFSVIGNTGAIKSSAES